MRPPVVDVHFIKFHNKTDIARNILEGGGAFASFDYNPLSYVEEYGRFRKEYDFYRLTYIKHMMWVIDIQMIED